MSAHSMKCVLLCLVGIATGLNTDPFAIVRTEQGLLKGIKSTSVRDKEFWTFLGIPYAKAPNGNLRFKAPQEPDAWEGTYDATSEKNECPQLGLITGVYQGDEDCLFLNVYTNKLPSADSQLQAVMVWIHGGSFTSGSSVSYVYGPAHLLAKDVVIVTFNYRLGLLGFASLPEAGVPGNNGMKDQVMALKWVQKNIACFGGDPNKVTIFGESAGGASVHLHMFSPMSKGLFHLGISQSGTALHDWAYHEPDVLHDNVVEVGRRLNCSEKTLLLCLQRAAPQRIVEATHMGGLNVSNMLPIRPTREDGSAKDQSVFLPDKPTKLISQVPYLTGINSREAMFYIFLFGQIPNFWASANEYVTKMLAYLLKMEEAQADELADMAISYYVKHDNVTKQDEQQLCEMFSDVGFVLGTARTVQKHAQESTQPVFHYYFDFEGELGLVKYMHHTNITGVSHGDELGYIWNTALSPAVEENSDEWKTLQRMTTMWTNFAKYGAPTCEKDAVKWTPATQTDHCYLYIGKDLSLRHDLLKKRLQFWEDMTGTR